MRILNVTPPTLCVGVCTSLPAHADVISDWNQNAYHVIAKVGCPCTDDRSFRGC